MSLLSRPEKWPTKSQWRQFFKVLTKREKIFFLVFLGLFLFSLIFLISNFYLKNTESKPTKGGIHIEGVIGQPRFINPIYANSDVDRDISELIFSGLMKYDENLQVIPDLIQNYEIEEDGKVYKFYLKENLRWQDKTPITADDIIFTIKTIQDPEYKSPLRANWVGVEVEKISDLGVKFRLRKPYNAFLENCTLKILPKHIWQDISPEEFAFNVHNLKPIGSGPYKLEETKQEKNEKFKSLTLKENPIYFGKKVNISEIKFLFFNDENDLIKAAKQGKVKGFSLSSFQKTNKRWQEYSLSMPRYFAVFFNPDKSDILVEKDIRIALNYATNKKEIVKKVLNVTEESSIFEKTIIDSPILPKIYGFDEPLEIYNFDIEKANNILDEAGFIDENQDGIREIKNNKQRSFQFKKELSSGSSGTEVEELQKCLAKDPDIYPEGDITSYFGEKTEKAVNNFQEKYASEILEPWGFTEGTGMIGKSTRAKLNEICFSSIDETLPLKFSLATVDQPQLIEVAEELKKQWKAIGVEVEINKFSISQLEQEIIKPRNYDALLFGEVLGAIPDLSPFWHSSQKVDPGLNLAMYNNQEVDKLLEDIRKSSNQEEINKKLITFQNILIENAPVVFLYCPEYIYFLSKEIKGISIEKITGPSKRFLGIEDWYIKTKRTWK